MLPTQISGTYKDASQKRKTNRKKHEPTNDTEKKYDPRCGRVKIKQKLSKERTKEKRKDHRVFEY